MSNHQDNAGAFKASKKLLRRARAAMRRCICEALENRMLMSTSIWTGAGGDADFSTPGNWQQNAAPQSGGDVVFPSGASSTAVTVDTNVNLGSLSISDAGYTIIGSRITLSGGLSATGSSEIDSNITLAGTQTVSVADGTLTLGGNIDDGGNAFGITKTGTGTLNIAGDGTYAGNTEVSAGVMEVDGTLSSHISLAEGAALDGNGLVGGISSTGGDVSPGLSGNAGQLIDSGGLSLDSTSTLSLELDGNTAGTGANFYGQVSTGGNVALNGAALSVTLGPDYTPGSGDVLTLISNGGSSTTGTFAGLPEGSLLTLPGNNVFRISYVGGSGHDTTLSYVRASTVTVSSSAAPSVVGQAVTLTANVTPTDGQSGTPTGTVTFYQGGVAIGSAATLDGNAQATVSDSVLPLGSHPITATYSGDSGFQSATSDEFTQVVNPDSTTTSLASSTAGASVWGQSVTFTATVAAIAPGTDVPSGTVQFFAAGSPIGSPQSVSAGSATFRTSALTVGAKSITATFTSSSGSDTGSTSAALTQTVSKSSTTTTVASSNPSAVVGQSVVFTATVLAAGNGAGVRTGTVTFKDNGTTIGTGAVNTSGIATFATSSLSLATHPITAVYGGDIHFLTSTASSVSQSVGQASSRVLVTTSATPAVYGQSITLNASVAALAPGSGTPTGSATFSVDGTPIGTVALSSGHAAISAGVLSVGSHSIVVSYGGDSNYANSTSSTVTQLVNQAPVAVGISSSSSTAVFGQTVSYSVTVAAAGNGSGTPTGGVVTLTDGSTSVGTGTLVNGAVSIDVSSLSVASHTITATYAGNANFLSNSASTSQTINAASTTTIVSSSGTPSVAGQPVTFTAAISADAPGSAAISGTTAFFDNDLSHQIGSTQTVSNAAASVTTSTLTQGAHNIFAVFTPGNGNILTSTSASIVQSDNQASTTTVVTSSGNHSAFGHNVILTATVAPAGSGGGIPTGTVTFYSDSAQIGSPVAVGNDGTAAVDVSALSVATHSITAVYSGDTNYSGSDNTSAALTQVVDQAATATVITADHSPSVFGQSVTFTATVGINGNGAGTRTGTVTFDIDSAPQAPVNVVDGVARLTLSSLSVSGHDVDATYNGDANFAGSSATTFTQTVNLSSTTSAVSSSKASAVFGEGVTLTATVTPTSPGAGTPNSGIVTFYSDADINNPLGTGTVSNGVATLTNVTLPVGTHSITAGYAGNANFDSDTSPGFSQSVARAATSLVLTAPATVVYGQTATLTATLSILGQGAGTPTGNVVFYADGDLINPIGTQSISANSASIAISSLGVGTHTITAQYVGDSSFLPSSAAGADQIVSKSGTTTTVVSSANFISGDYQSVYGQTVTFSATVAPAGAGVGTPIGTVTFMDGNAILGTAGLSNGVATLATTTLSHFLALGDHAITASYGDDANFNASDSSGTPITQSVAQASTTSTVTSSLSTSVFGQDITLSATVVPQSPGNGTPTGTIAFFSDGTQVGSAQTLSGGAASVDVSGLIVNTHSLTVVYSGDTNYATSTSGGVSQIVHGADTTVALTSSDNAPVTGESVTLTAVVAATAGSAIPTGTVTFFDNTIAIGSAQALTSGQATLTTILPLGANSLTASYTNADSNFNPSTTPSSLSNPVGQDAATVGVVSSVNSSVFGQSTTFTATVAAAGAGSGTPTGTVTFFSDGAQIGSPVTLISGAASLPYAALSADTHDISATYSGDADFLTNAGTVTQTVNPASTTLALGATTNSIYGANAALTATVTVDSPGVGVPTGIVYFFADGGQTPIGHATLSGGVATLNYSGLNQGDHSITAAYTTAGTNFTSASGSNSVTQHVNQSPTTTTLQIDNSSTVFGQSVAFTATVSATGGGSGTPLGNVLFLDQNNNVIGSALLVNGQAVLHFGGLTVGSNAVRAIYAGTSDVNYLPSSTAPSAIATSQATTTISVSSSNNPVPFAVPITFTAQIAVTSPGNLSAGIPTGTVTFFDNGVSIGTGSADANGRATFTTAALGAADHPITAIYSGNDSYLGSSSSTLTQTVASASVGVSVSSTAQNNAVFGQSITLIATVAATGTPTGTITFFDGSNAISDPVALTNGQASLVTSTLSTGSHTLTARYSGDASYSNQTSPNFTQAILQSSTTTALISDHSSAVSGQNVMFAATVTAAGLGAGTPSGTVTFYSDGIAISGPIALNSGTASFTTSALSTAGHFITAIYNGSGDFLTSTSAALAQSQQQDASVATLNAGGSSSAFGANPALTATITAAAPGSGTPTGTVWFYDGSGANAVSLGQGTLSGGVATLTSYTLAAGSHSLSVLYSGDANFASITSGTTSYTVNPATTSVTLSGAATGEYGQSLSDTATVAVTNGGGVPTGSISFFDGQLFLATVAMTAGSATLNHGYGVGLHSLTATYLPTGGNFAGSSTISAYSVNVSAASTSTTLASTTSSVAGQPVTFNATVAISGNGVGTPGGLVSFYDNGTLLGTSGLAAGHATFTTAALTVGSHPITAVYGTDDNFAGSSASAVNQQVALASLTASVTSAVASAPLGQTVIFTATLAPVAPGAGVPTGQVTFMNGGALLGFGTLDSNGQATFTTSALTLGSHDITVVFPGDANFATVTSNAYSQSITQASSSLSLTSSTLSSLWGQSVTFTAIPVGSGAGLVSGTITFFDGATQIGTGVFSGSNTVTATVSNLSVGSHSITAVFDGNTNYAGSNATPITEQVAMASGTASVTSVAALEHLGQSITFTATIAAASPSHGIPTGIVTFMNGNTVLGTGALDNTGLATLTTSGLALGSHGITAVYAGDGNVTGVISSPYSQTIGQDSTATVVSSSSPNSVSGQSVTFTATPSGTGGGPVTGTVTFFDGSTQIGSRTFDGATPVTVTVSNLTVGSHSVTAVFGGSTNYAGSTSTTVSQQVAQSNTTASVTSDNASVALGQSVTFTATLAAAAPNTGVPTGIVTFMDGASVLGTGTLDNNGQTTLSTSALTIGSHGITLVYGGDANFAPVTSSTYSQTVAQDPTSIAVTSSSLNSVWGQSLTFTATPVGTGGGPVTGTVTFLDGSTQIGIGTFDGTNPVTATVLNLPVGSHSITAIFGGSAHYAASTSPGITQQVARASSIASVTSTLASAPLGQSITFTATVTAASLGAGVPTGLVTFMDGNTLLGTGSLSPNGIATLTTSALTLGSNSITAVYGGDSNFTGVTSLAYTQTAGQDSTTLTLGSSAQNAVSGQSVTFSAAPAGTGGGPLTGTVQFLDGFTVIGTGNFDGVDPVTATVSNLSLGTHSITATFSGNTNYAASISSGISQQIGQAGTSASVTSTTASVGLGLPVTLTATLAAVSPGSGVPTGMVTFMDGNAQLGTGTLDNNGLATFTTSSLILGSHSITAIYNGDANFTGITSTAYSQNVAPDSSTTSLASSTLSSVSGQSVTFTATPAGTGGGPVTGAVTFFDGSTQIGSRNFDGTNPASITVSNLTVASHSITAVFAGSTNYAGSTSTAISQVVAQGSTSATLTTSASPALPGAAVTLTATIAAVSPATGTPSGTVGFFDGSTLLGSGVLSNGVATLTTANLVAGNHSLTATYLGDANFTAATSPAASFRVAIPGTLQFGSATLTVNETGGAAAIAVTRTGGTDGVVGISYSVTGGTAVNGTNFNLSAGTLTFADGQSTANITLPVTNDGRFGIDKSVILTLGSPTGGATLGSAINSTITIHDDNPQPSLSVSSPTVIEAANGTGVARFAITLSVPANVEVDASYATFNGSATSASGSYTAASGQLVFSPGTTTQFVNVNVNGTTTPGTNQTFALQLANPVNATTGFAGTATIVNNNFANPVVTNVAATVTPGSTAVLNALANAHSNDPGPMTLSILTAPAFGAASVVTVNGVQSLSYVPGPGAVQSDSFTYQVTDAHGHSSTGTATVTFQGAGLVVSSLQSNLTDLVVVGTSGNDNILFTQASKNIQVLFNGTTGTFAPTGRVMAFGQAGNDVITATGITSQAWFYSGTGNDTLIGGGASDVLVGGGGADFINGNGGRNILIGGAGASTLKSLGADILIAGTTLYDAPTAANQAVLNTVLNQWINHKKSTIPLVGRNPGTPEFSASTITAGSGDILLGNKNSWFFGDFTFNGGSDVFSDGRHVKKGHTLLPTAKELVTDVGH